MRWLIVVACVISCSMQTLAGSNQGYYRFPAIHGNKIVFTAEGDLWTVSTAGGVAMRLTTSHGVESHAAISPNGVTLAFSAEYEGPTEIYTMPVDGGVPKRMTYDGETATMVGWTPGNKIVYATTHFSTLPNVQLVILNPADGSTVLFPLAQASGGVFTPNEDTIFFTRLPFQGSHTKRYKGGTAQNIWRYVRGANEAIPLTADYEGTSKNPMIWSGRLFFASDRDGTMNIWSMGFDGRDVRQETFHKGFDVASPSLDDGQIAYQCGADIYLFDIATKSDKVVHITLSSDFDQEMTQWVKKPMDYLTSAHPSPDGDRVVLTARGQVFVAPVGEGRFVEVTRESGVRYRNARFTPDGKSLILQSDRSGEVEFWKYPANGVGAGEQLTHDGKGFRMDGIPSPDGNAIVYTDKNYRLLLYSVDSRKTKVIATSEYGEFGDPRWSPDSKWIAYVSPTANTYNRIALYDLTSDKTFYLTDDRTDSYSPTWSPDGKWLYFLSDRNFQSLVLSPWGTRQPEPFFANSTKIYALALTTGERFPFAPSDELEPASPSKEEKGTADARKKDAKSGEKKNIEVKIELENIQSRIYEVPVPAGEYSHLSMNDKILLATEDPVSADRKRRLDAIEIKNKDVAVKAIVEDIKGYELSGDGKKIMVQKGEGVYVIDAAATPVTDLSKSGVNLSKWIFSFDPREEWRQMFTEAWRLERDFFYDPGMQGVDYDKTLQRYLPLVDRVRDRDELNDLISQIVSELCALHTFVVGGQLRRETDQVAIGSLGASLSRDERNGGYRIDHIYRSDPDYLDDISPLAKTGLKIREGDVIESINGVQTLSVPALNELLENQGGRQVLLHVKPAASGKAFDEVVTPISAQASSNLRYDEWEYTRRLAVDSLSENQIGYVHLRAMGGTNFYEWAKEFYPVFNRQGLIVDVRHNRGGNIDSWILEKLMRKAWMYWQSRVGVPSWNMQYAFRGHVVVLCNERTASDGEAFTEGFRRLGLGKVIGSRTWGGEIWLSFDNWLRDNGIASAAEYGVYGPESQWLIEGHGVNPDIVVDDTPHQTFLGKDAQLEEAVKYLKQEIKEHPVPVPPPPAYPNKAMDYGK